MAYEITIKERKTTTELVRGEWGKVCDDKDADYGYAPDREGTVTNVKTIYEQTVEELDIQNLIIQINTKGEK